jgi:hypothetical protein
LLRAGDGGEYGETIDTRFDVRGGAIFLGKHGRRPRNLILQRKGW